MPDRIKVRSDGGANLPYIERKNFFPFLQNESDEPMMLCCPENASGAAGGGPVAGPSSSGGPPSLAGDGSFSFCNNSQSTDDLGVESMCDDLDFDFNFEEAAAASTSSLCQQQPGFSYRYVLFLSV